MVTKRSIRPAPTWAMLLLLAAATVFSASAQTPPTYQVRPGDTLFRIAESHSISLEALRRLNDLRGDVIRVGQTLVVGHTLPPDVVLPKLPDRIEAVTDSSGTVLYGTYAPASSESLLDIAQRLGVLPDTLRALNGPFGIVLADGPPVHVPAQFSMRRYRVRAGDTLFRIAAAQGTSVGGLRRANALANDRIVVGQVLDVPSGAALSRAPRLPDVAARGTVSVYLPSFKGRLMASGRPYEPGALTVAHPEWPLATVVLLERGGRTVLAEVADRMPARSSHVLEVSDAVASALGGTDDQPVSVRIIERGR